MAQDTLTLSLEEAIQRGITVSVDAVSAKNQYKSSYWTYRTYKSELFPEISFNATLPYFSKSYNSFQESDGSYTFVSNYYSQIHAGISVSQNVPFTGGSFSVSSNLQQLKQYGNNSYTSYMTVPFSITFEQPIFGFNSLRWKQKIEPLKYKEAEQELIAQMEEIANKAIQYYFNLLLSRINLEIAEQNLENAEKLYVIAQARRKIGQISETDLQQLNLSLLKSEAFLTSAQSSLNAQMFQLRSFLRYNESIIIIPESPELFTENIPILDYQKVLNLALINNSFTQNAQRRTLEAARNVRQAKADR
ncbi:TolC family protein, partial [Bacteroidales bacterium OttesenSCG-928-C19]|nr:TolC family protein [Bacteroidales bacterium OttesenSCG-928-C19]